MNPNSQVGITGSWLLSKLAGIVSTLPTYESNLYEINFDNDKQISTNITMVVIANGNLLGGVGFNATSGAKISDGLMALSLYSRIQVASICFMSL